MKHFLGLDLSMKATAVQIVDDASQRIRAGSVPNIVDAIAAIVIEKALDLIQAGMTSDPQVVWLWHALRDSGIRVDCLGARRAAATVTMQANKTDCNDAFGIGHLVHRS